MQPFLNFTNRKSYLTWLLVLFVFGSAMDLHSQTGLTVTSVSDATQLAQTILGPNVQIVSATLTVANADAAGSFPNDLAENLSLDSGIILSTGNILTRENCPPETTTTK